MTKKMMWKMMLLVALLLIASPMLFGQTLDGKPRGAGTMP